jgi:hypothetical protein
MANIIALPEKFKFPVEDIFADPLASKATPPSDVELAREVLAKLRAKYEDGKPLCLAEDLGTSPGIDPQIVFWCADAERWGPISDREVRAKIIALDGQFTETGTRVRLTRDQVIDVFETILDLIADGD